MPTLLISAPYQTGGLFSLDTDSGEVEVIDHGFSGTGLTKIKGQYLQIANGCLIGSWLSRHEKCEDEENPWIHDAHYYDYLDELWVANTRQSTIDRYSLDWNRLKWKHKGSYGPLVEGADQIFKACNLNSFLYHPQYKGIYGCAFALSNEKEGWRSRPGEGVIFRFPTARGTYQKGSPEVEVLVEGLQQPHTLQWAVYGPEVLICNSIPGEIIRYRMRSWEETARYTIQTKEGKTGFTRGIVQLDYTNMDTWFVGLSANRHPSIYGHEDQERYTVKTAHVVQVDHRGRTVNSWPLPCHEIYDIVVV